MRIALPDTHEEFLNLLVTERLRLGTEARPGEGWPLIGPLTCLWM
jgi:hypothetical protein